MIKAIAERIKGLREDSEISVDDMAKMCRMEKEEYERCENGEVDYTFSFLNRCAHVLKVDLQDLLTGASGGRLHSYQIVRKGEGLPVDRRKGFSYLHLASLFHDNTMTPLRVVMPYDKQALKKLVTNSHEGLEFDYVLEGKMRFLLNGKTFTLNEGDSAIYDSSLPHGMAAESEEGCTILAVVIEK